MMRTVRNGQPVIQIHRNVWHCRDTACMIMNVSAGNSAAMKQTNVNQGMESATVMQTVMNGNNVIWAPMSAKPSWEDVQPMMIAPAGRCATLRSIYASKG